MSQTPETQLAYLGFQLIQPGRLLSPFIRSYWYFRRAAPLHTCHEEYMNPSGGYGIAFNFGDVVQLGAQTITEPVFLHGANTISRAMGFFGRVEQLGIRFYEGGAFPFIGVPLIELQNEIDLLDAMDRTDLLRLHARLQEAVSLPARICLLENWLVARLNLGKEQNALVPPTLQRLRKSNGRYSISALAQEFAISQRQMERIYQVQVGMSPKQYAQLQRVEAARLALKNTNGKSMAELATELGFYDQSHFIREFNAVIGISPHTYLKRSYRNRDCSGKWTNRKQRAPMPNCEF